MEAAHEAALIPLIERQIRFAYASHPVHQSVRTTAKPQMLLAAIGVLPGVFRLCRWSGGHTFDVFSLLLLP
jgi:hypothetical protein